MIRNPATTLYVLEHIGLPLINAVTRANIPRSEEVEKVRTALDSTVSCAQEIETLLDISKSSSDKAAYKMKIAALASKIIAAQFEGGREIWDGKDLKRIDNLLEPILAYAEGDHFGEGNIDSKMHNNYVNYISIFAPILPPIAEFSYGQPENKAIQYASKLLIERSKDLEFKLLGLPEYTLPNQNTFDPILRTLATLYAETHQAETKKIMQMDEKIRLANSSQLTIDIVWRAFDRKLSMLEALIEGLVPVAKQTEIPGFSSSLPTLEVKDQNSMEVIESPSKKKESPLSFFIKKKN